MDNAPRAFARHGPVPASHTTLSAQDRADLAAMNAASSRIKRATEGGPYYQTIEQQHGLEGRYEHRYKYPAFQWLHNAPFHDRERESMQYQTFDYTRSRDTVISLHPHQYLDRPTTADKSRNPTGPNTPSQGPKKIMSLDAYKKKAAGGTPAAVPVAAKQPEKTVKPPALKGPAEREKAESAAVLAAINDIESEEAAVTKKTATDTTKSQAEQVSAGKSALKRKRDDEKTAPDTQPSANGISSQPAVKKAKISEPAPTPAVVSKVQQKERSPPPAVKSPKKLIERRIERPVEKPAQKPIEKPTGQLTEKPIEKPTEKPTKKPTEKPTEKSVEKPVGVSIVKPIKKPVAPIDPPESADTSLPPRLSPLHEEEPTKTDSPLLPDRLSPSLPANITAALKARKPKENAAADLSAPNLITKKDGTLTPVPTANGVLKHKSPAPRNGFRANSGSPSNIDVARRPPLKTSAPDVDKESTKRSDSTTEKPSAITILKFKKHKEVVKRILILKPTPKPKEEPAVTPQPSSITKPIESSRTASAESRTAGKTVPSSADGRDSARRAGKGVAQKLGPGSKKADDKRPLAEKRPRDRDDVEEPKAHEATANKRKVEADPTPKPKANVEADSEPVAKRRKPDPLELKKTPSTPAQPHQQSPTAPSAQKSQHITPGARNNLLSTSMKRDLSNDSHTNTPSAHSSTPVLNGHASSSQSNGTTKPSPTSQPSNKTSMQAAWEARNKSLEVLGREIKHSAQADVQSDPNTAQKRRAAVKSVECLICYILAFTCADEASLAADPKQKPVIKIWRSLTAFSGFVQRLCEPFPLVAGLAAHLAVVFNTRILELTAQKPTEGPSRESIIELASAQKTALDDAEDKLDIDTLIDNFPKTWKGRTKGLKQQDPALDPKTMLLGSYALPIGAHTTSARAARAGLALLREYIDSEKIDYELRVKP